LTYLGDGAFDGVASIAISKLPDGLTYIGDEAFFIDLGSSSAVPENDYSKVSLTFTALPSCLTYIGAWGCYHNPNLISVSGLNDLTGIGENAFKSCSNLASVVIPDGVTIISANSFAYCSNITDITIGRNVSEIGKYAFYVGTGVKIRRNITVLAETPPALYGVESLGGGPSYERIYTIIVPKGCGDAYKAAEYWSEYADYIVEAS
jgi:hypothetical protein